jgi:hypothetical protein
MRLAAVAIERPLMQVNDDPASSSYVRSAVIGCVMARKLRTVVCLLLVTSLLFGGWGPHANRQAVAAQTVGTLFVVQDGAALGHNGDGHGISHECNVHYGSSQSCHFNAIPARLYFASGGERPDWLILEVATPCGRSIGPLIHPPNKPV